MWLILALAQAASTELIADEAYYWVYSRFPAWGYFDHPPMIAMLVKLGYSIFQNELGVRLISALLSLFTIMITESLTERKNPFLFYTIVLSIAVLQIAGFMAVPDTPLLFFTALFFYLFRSFISNAGLINIFLLSLTIAALFYTKYHGLLIVFFAFLSTIRLFARWQTWIAGLIVLVLYSPHLLWQWQHDWVSFRYHLFESNVSTYKFSYTTDYLLGQLLLAGPLAGFILLPAAILYKPKNQLERSLKFTFNGIYIIFLISSFRGKVEPNWTMPAIIPLIVLSHQFILEKISWIKPLRLTSVASLVLIIAGRLYLAVDIGPDNSTKGRFHNNKAWAKAIAAKTGDAPVVFYNSYQRTSLFWFYSGKQSHSHNYYGERKSNYNFWPTERELLGRKVFIADIHNISAFPDSVKTKKGWVGIRFDSSYSALARIQLIPDQTSITISNNRSFMLKCTRIISDQYYNFLKDRPGLPTELYAGVFNGKDLVQEISTGITAQSLANSPAFNLDLHLTDLKPGKYILRLGLKVRDYPTTHNSGKIQLFSE